MPYIVEGPGDIIMPWRVESTTRKIPLAGAGYLAGEFPGGITTVEGVPTAATVRILLRADLDADPYNFWDGAVVAEVQSASDGTWEVTGLQPGMRYDVVGRKDGFNDVIMADVTPASA